MFAWIGVFGIVLCGLGRPGQVLTVKPHYTCEEFEEGAHFDPYETIDNMWKIFYFWANTSEINPIVFSLPAKKRLDRFKTIVDAVDPYMGVEWQKATLIMEPRPGVEVVFLYGGTPGAFRALVKLEHRQAVRPHPIPDLKLADIRMKIVGRYLGMMCCEDLTRYALARMDEMPLTEAQCQTAARTLGFSDPGGRSYLHVANLTARDFEDEL